MELKELQNKIYTVFKPLTFDEKRHIYYWYGQKVSKSVSAKVKQFEEPFEADKVITKDGRTLIQLSAAKQSRLQNREVTEHELRHTWQTLAKEGCELGSETHDYMEFYNGVKLPRLPQEFAGVKYLTDMLNEMYVDGEGKLVRRYEILCRELRMYSVRFKFAGTADLILADRKYRTIVVVDYKTNKDLFKVYGYLKNPFHDLESHPYNKYQLQLSYYQLMFEEMIGIKVSARHLIHLKADSNYIKFELEDYSLDLIQVHSK